MGNNWSCLSECIEGLECICIMFWLLYLGFYFVLFFNIV